MNKSYSYCHGTWRLRHGAWLRPGVCVLLWLLSSAAFAAVAFAADPFYERLFQDGTLAQENGAHNTAEKKLRLACFGMLDQPQQLAKCLTHLALAQAALEKQDDFLSTLGRILETERRFQAFSKADLAPRQRQEFARWLEQWASYESIADLPAFRDVAEAKRAMQLRALPAAERRQELDRRLALEPNHPQWRLMWAELEWQAGNHVAAVKAANELLQRQPANHEARCLRGLATERSAPSCTSDTVLADLALCANALAESATEARLRCLVATAQWQSAQQILTVMPEEQQKTRSVRGLARQVRKGLRNAPEATPPSEPPPPSRVEAQGVSKVTPPPPAPPQAVATAALSDSERGRLEAGRKALKADDRQVFESMLEEVSTIADRRRQSAAAQQLAAEIAYRLTRWDIAVTYFRRAETNGPLTPVQQFYLAISLYKSGDQAAAVIMLDRCLPQIQQSDFVRFWAKRIREKAN